ncbi:Serine phosphatase [Acidisarcina polymorpha]|uniref:Serine phosphatase n=1 Tax=Acidisarcina polymorpha TaxID=2211140 RepID=A0A2Z5FSE9_9BACT|nr:SpoIIE family protein phosphatase [Acidisarcina polymorpha]AXC09733.1 Serine phosphatase [Acidisarcina polymorpha]
MPGLLRKFESGVYRRLGRVPPQTKLHRTAFWLLISYLLLGVGRLLPGNWGHSFSDMSVLVLWALIVCSIPLFWRWVMRRVLWKVSHRLVVTYLLMGLAPIVLFGTLALVATYTFSGQFATFAATSEINRELAHITAENRAFSVHVARELEAHPETKAVTLPEFDDDSAFDRGRVGLEVAAFEDGKPLALATARPLPPGLTSIPPWFKDHFRGLVLGHGRVFLRAADTQTVGSHQIVLVTSLPLEKGNLDQIASGLGTVTIVPGMNSEEENDRGLEPNLVTHVEGDAKNRAVAPHADLPPPAPPAPGGVHMALGRPDSGNSEIRVNGKPLGDEERHGGAVTGGTLPEPTHFFDVTVSFVAPMQAIIWSSGKEHESFIHVNSRPSLLYERLFITSLQVATVIQDVLISIAAFFGLLELIAFVMAVRLNRTITNSINELYVATQAIDEGDLHHRIIVTRHDQLAALSKSFNEMTASLEELLEEQREKERLQSELEIAQQVQANLFPRQDVTLSMLDLHGVCRPARSVSGDYYDFLVFGPSTLGLALGDISGKGISAALLMATLHSAVRAYQFASEELITVGTDAMLSPSFQMVKSGVQEINCGEMFESPGRVLALLNRHLYRSTQPEKYATLFLAHYEGKGSRLTYSNGGQLPPLVLRGDRSVTRLDRGGTVVGLMDGMSYDEGTIHLTSGDIVIAYSDGVTEPENEFGDFGEERLLEVVSRNRHLPLSAISDLVMQALRSWIGTQEQPDDITLVLARQR